MQLLPYIVPDMKSYSEGIFEGREIDLLHKAERIVEQIPSSYGDDNKITRCHEVARIVGKILRLEVQDGYYGYIEHSWCWTSKLNPKLLGRIRMGIPNILDTYCVGSLPQVRLVACDNSALPHTGFAYRPDTERTDIDKEFVRKTVLSILKIKI
jgi:hypothetical protein